MKVHRDDRPGENATRRTLPSPAILFTFKEVSLRTLLSCAVALGARAAPAADVFPAFVPVKQALKAEKWDAAIEAGKRVVEKLPASSAAHRFLGQAYGQKAIHASLFSQIGLAKKCRAEFERAIALDPGDPEARVDLVTYYANAPGFLGGGLDKAREQVDILNGLDAARGALMNGYVLAKEKKTVEAEAEYRRAVALSPDDAGFRVRFGHFLERTGRKDEAKDSYREALRLDPALEGAKRDLERLGG